MRKRIFIISIITIIGIIGCYFGIAFSLIRIGEKSENNYRIIETDSTDAEEIKNICKVFSSVAYKNSVTGEITVKKYRTHLRNHYECQYEMKRENSSDSVSTMLDESGRIISYELKNKLVFEETELQNVDLHDSLYLRSLELARFCAPILLKHTERWKYKDGFRILFTVPCFSGEESDLKKIGWKMLKFLRPFSISTCFDPYLSFFYTNEGELIEISGGY